ncbi:nicotinate-nucleotide adenylyltransferase [Anaerovirgula multivorans]|uniref:Probable nicotinate-nucleotide adenylyltransferase n=1 Tax=Anaerovirgula multivorans TaxID=312168 RepID=A0A239DRH8_9FIRM|nr:nicotinate-nucleotide adenylyltransferase [Anaerovirgula multivorans]SNS34809.1 nicotinate-nucleotide adenylyltransferase [Anaerovirgula multivorans]
MNNKDRKITHRYGIMGGTFDPIHLGHLFVAETALYNLNLDKVIFIPTGNPPHKNSKDITIAHHRLIMTAVAINSNPKFELSNIEVMRRGQSYTADTIKQLLMQYGENIELYFITGTDAFMEMSTWKDCAYLFRTMKTVVATRLGYDDESFNEKVHFFNKKYNASIINMSIPILEISSSDIRERIRQKLSIKYLVTEGVEKYIKKHHLYVKNINESL